ncbi:MAG TPA: reverse transcriptase-like protein, partial [Polyangiaceae bacterium]
QVQRKYKVKAPHLQPLYEKAMAMLARFREWNIEHVRREQNTRADELANEALNDGYPRAPEDSGDER